MGVIQKKSGDGCVYTSTGAAGHVRGSRPPRLRIATICENNPVTELRAAERSSSGRSILSDLPIEERRELAGNPTPRDRDGNCVAPSARALLARGGNNATLDKRYYNVCSTNSRAQLPAR
ncbi:hypothetical protein EVAR_42594_1 [Eumeta japonica]|uniref:Uncharacterized protein n=1 Tax=Eumeta variegata TaxID=151549 RepID=A0A4C1XQ00_EUMVA|nr:hypothetical protein EVAR_42594_1 [Eumeta japonica]